MRELIEQVQRETERINEVSWQQAVGTAALAGMIATGVPNPALAKTPHHYVTPNKHYSDGDYINAVVGEASMAGYQGMLDVACALRNRIKDPYHAKDPLHQVFGYNAAHNKKETKETWETAKKAWKDSANQDTVNGAIIWGNANDVKIFKRSGWFKNVELVKTAEGHSFFRIKKH
jgi:hypothetical protein